MNDAVSGTERIRSWDYHKIGIENLANSLSTNIKSGLDN